MCQICPNAISASNRTTARAAWTIPPLAPRRLVCRFSSSESETPHSRINGPMAPSISGRTISSSSSVFSTEVSAPFSSNPIALNSANTNSNNTIVVPMIGQMAVSSLRTPPGGRPASSMMLTGRRISHITAIIMPIRMIPPTRLTDCTSSGPSKGELIAPR